LGNGAWWQIEESNVKNCRSSVQDKSNIVYDEELYVSCMKRFLYLRCYDSLELLSSLKVLFVFTVTLHSRIRQQEVCGSQVGVLMIDSIGAFHWTDRLSSSLALEKNNRKSLSLTNVVETIVQEAKKLLQVHSLVVIATKATIYEEKYPANENNRNFSSNDDLSGKNASSKAQQPPNREFMPSSWQAFVTHKIIIRKSADDQSLQTEQQSLSAYSLEWLQPHLSSIDRFTVDHVFFNLSLSLCQHERVQLRHLVLIPVDGGRTINAAYELMSDVEFPALTPHPSENVMENEMNIPFFEVWDRKNGLEKMRSKFSAEVVSFDSIPMTSSFRFWSLTDIIAESPTSA
ncbi:unnamed protein product, partial [Arabis nemorensis]